PHGGTTLAITPAQYRAEPSDNGDGPLLSTLRQYGSMDFRLYYSRDNGPGALAGAPAIANVVGLPQSDGTIRFSATVTHHPDAPIQDVWLTYTGTHGLLVGTWQSLALSRR